uniref:MI domain-containing protein n=1 Tax=Heterorhabditis bacteriophora TaxID=37862 RepID=A0A1I7WY71_HETBA
MMCDWLAALGDDPISLSRKPRNKEQKDDRSKMSPPRSPMKKFDEKTIELCDGRLEAAKCIEDTLAGLITKHFSPEMADKIFEDGGVIDWLPELIAHRSVGFSLVFFEALRARLLGKEHETTALRTAISQTADDQVATHVVQALLTMTSKGELNPADITIIYDQFIMPHPPPIEVIRDAVLEDLLLDALFHCDGPKVRIKYFIFS